MTAARRPASRPSGRWRGSSELRLRVGLIVLAMVVSVFGVRLIQLQGLDPKAYAAKANAEGLVTVPLPATRGAITDRNGVALAESVSGLMIVGDPKRTDEHAEEIAQILANRLHLDYFDVLARLRIDPEKPDSRFAYVARRVPATLARAAVAAIDKAGYKGIDTRNDPVRDYPAGDVAANLLGYLKADGQADSGGGLERSFDPLLSGKDGSETYEVGGGNRIPLGENTEVKPVNGKDVTLTIDRDVQWYAQRVLRTAVQGARAQSGAAVALDTQTGEILALADYPTYDANKASEANKDDLGSRALSDVYEPGSVEKVLTMSGLLDKGLVTPTTRVRVPHQLPVADRVIHDYFQHDMLRLTLAGVIAKSSNIGTVLAARQYKPGQLWHYLDLFGLGHRTDVGMPGETRGLLPDPSTWTELTQATASFGQGVSVNALQMASAINAVANGGEFISPSLVEGRAVTSSGDAVGTATATRHRVVSQEAAAKMSRMMEMVTTEGAGTAPGAGIAGYRVAGKTGTAQQVGAKCRCYDGSLAVSFAGFAPADNPRFTVYVVIQKPQGGASGGGTAGPVFRKILTYLLQKYAVPPTNTRPAHLPVEW
ncbi:MAG TPA: penicillin-binding protein 2 [Marmoricola sp.]|nr:penicillin-binding protein 2 [Marmoricola sp.]